MVNMLTKKQFDLLTFLEKYPKTHTQRKIADETSMSLGSANKTLTELKELNYITDNKINAEGLNALEPYRVKRAIFIAAGFGSRLVPITLNTPKPLVRVKGVRIIDTLIDAVLAAGIDDIVIVRGYLGEQFDQLLYKYPMIKFIENPSYNESNNISSALCARYLMTNAYVCEADLLLYNPNLITKYQYQSNYLGVPVDRTDDWCFKTENGFISKIMVGGTDCYHMFGISYWDKKAGLQLANDIKTVFEMPGGKERYWDQVALEYFLPKYFVAVRECSFNDIVEIDTYTDLKRLDKTYI
jgi:CTP:phosphocholine cytidylyltransferase-like protein